MVGLGPDQMMRPPFRCASVRASLSRRMRSTSTWEVVVGRGGREGEREKGLAVGWFREGVSEKKKRERGRKRE